MEHTEKNKSYTGIIIAIVVLVAVLIIISIIPHSAANRPMMNNQQSTPVQQQPTMNQSDEPQAIQSDIDSRLETDF